MVYQKNSSKARKSTSIKKKLFLQSLEKNLGVISPALKEVDINRATYLRWAKADPKFKEELDNINNTALDFAESQLYKNIKAGKEASLIFYLKCKGQERGYIERQQIDQNVSYNQPLKLEIIPPPQLPPHDENIIDITEPNKKLKE